MKKINIEFTSVNVEIFQHRALENNLHYEIYTSKKKNTKALKVWGYITYKSIVDLLNFQREIVKYGIIIIYKEN